MSVDPQTPRPIGAASSAGGEVTLAGVLSIFWRRKPIIIALTLLGFAAGFAYTLVVTPLYMATAQVQPGITSYTDRGGPIREWRLKDIVNYYRRGLHMDSVRQKMGWAEDEGRPVVRADFIPRGAQNIQGGNVITLQTLSPSPEQAAAVMEAAVASFVEYAEADTVASDLYLTRQGLRIQISQLQNELEELNTQKERLNLGIAEQEAELELIGAEQRRIDMEMRKIDKDNTYRQAHVALNRKEVEAALARLQDMELALDRLKSKEPDPIAQRDSLLQALDERGLSAWLLSDLFRNDAEAMSEIILGSLKVRDKAHHRQMDADSLQHEIELAGFFVENLKIKKEVELEKQRVDIRNKIAELTLDRDRGLQTKKTELANNILSKRVQLSALTPLERIGRTTATKAPVRPRKLRAISILTMLGLMGSLALALCWEYVSTNKDVIFSERAFRD